MTASRPGPTRTCRTWFVLGAVSIVVFVTLWWTTARHPTPQRAELPLPDQKAVGGAGETQPADLVAFQERIRKAARTALPAVVGVQNPGEARQPRLSRHEPGASGVIVSADGLVLSAHHVSHLKWDRADPWAAYPPGTKTRAFLADGRVCEAELLGSSRDHDLSLLRLVPSGPYPFVAIDPAVVVHRGDWVLKIGHPLGFRRDRSAPVRLGRIVARTADGFATDCPATGGDSGGPFFDLEGRLVGLTTPMIPDLMTRVLPMTSEDRFDATRTAAWLVSGRSCSLIDRHVGWMRAGETRRDPEAARSFDSGLVPAERLSPSEWTQGRASRELYRTVVAASGASTLAVMSGDVPVALGTAVGADGWVLTLASELPARPRCRLADGAIVEARVVGVDPSTGLALLKVEATLRPVAWAESPDPPVGTVLAAPAPAPVVLPLAVGVVSVRRRTLTDAAPPTHRFPQRVPANPPEIRGPEHFLRADPEGGAGGYLADCVELLAAAAGVRPGDRVVSISGRPVVGYPDLAEAVAGRASGDTVPLIISRGGQRIELVLPLSASTAYGSVRTDDFPTVFEHSAPLYPHECGGPVVDLSGRALGITVARVEQHGCLAVPADVVLDLLPKLQSGKLAVHWEGR
jgi:serine protease Do